MPLSRSTPLSFYAKQSSSHHGAAGSSLMERSSPIEDHRYAYASSSPPRATGHLPVQTPTPPHPQQHSSYSRESSASRRSSPAEPELQHSRRSRSPPSPPPRSEPQPGAHPRRTAWEQQQDQRQPSVSPLKKAAAAAAAPVHRGESASGVSSQQRRLAAAQAQVQVLLQHSPLLFVC